MNSEARAGQVPGVPKEAPPQRCFVCGTPLSGPLGYALRLFGIKRSARSTKVCSRCEAHAEAGRRLDVTILFADLSNFTALTHELGPEMTLEIVDAFLEMATDVLVHYDGYVDKYVGDAVMAIFNAPLRRADHARRAVAAALEIQARLPEISRRLKRDLKIRVGVSSGLALLGRVGSSGGKEITAIGDVVNLASRLQSQGKPGDVWVDEAVYRAVDAEFPKAARERLTLKGFAQAVGAFRLSEGSEPPILPFVSSARVPGVNLGSVVLAVLGAPCAVTVLFGPLAVPLGLGALFGAGGALAFLDRAAVRIPVLTLALLGAAANLYAFWHARRARARAEGAPELGARERRRAILALAPSAAVVLIVGAELAAHYLMRR